MQRSDGNNFQHSSGNLNAFAASRVLTRQMMYNHKNDERKQKAPSNGTAFEEYWSRCDDLFSTISTQQRCETHVYTNKRKYAKLGTVIYAMRRQ